MVNLADALDSHLMQEQPGPGCPLVWPFRVRPGYPPYEEPKYAHGDGLSSSASLSGGAASHNPMCTENEVLGTWKPGDKVWRCSHPGCTAQLRANCPECAALSGARLWRIFGWTRAQQKSEKLLCLKHNGLSWQETVKSHDRAQVCASCWIASISYFARHNLERLKRPAEGSGGAAAPALRESRRRRADHPCGLECMDSDGQPANKLQGFEYSTQCGRRSLRPDSSSPIQSIWI